MDPLLAIGLLLVVGLAIACWIAWRRHRRDYREHLEPILAAHDLQFVSARWPGFFNVGPFPSVEVEVGRPQTNILGIRGEHSQYRIVTVRDAEGQAFDVWANLEFERFRLRRVRWRTEEHRALPPAAAALLENAVT